MIRFKHISLFIFASPFLLPSAIMTATNYSALSLGIYICSLITIIYAFTRRPIIFIESFLFIKKFLASASILVPILILQILINGVTNNPVNHLRFLISLILIFIVIYSSNLFAKMIANTEPQQINKIIEYMMIFLFINAILGVFGISIFKYSSSKPVGIFSEPSHFALALSPILIFACATKIRFYSFYLLFFLFWGIFIENTTILTIIMLSALVSIRKRFFILFIAIMAIGVTAFDKSQYYLERLTPSLETDNLSVIALLRGWEIALLSAKQTNYLGGGFQQYGLTGLDGDLSSKLDQMDLGYLNLLDGASTAAKFIGEFGLIGLCFLLIYLFLMARSIIVLRSNNFNCRISNSSTILLFHAFIVSLFIELFIRGLGYASTGFFLFFAACSHLYKRDKDSDTSTSSK